MKSFKITMRVIGRLLLIYFAVAYIVYAFRHPEQTQTQLFFNIPDAMLWR